MPPEQPTAQTSCLNCGTALSGPFCYKCGEKKIDPSKDLKLSKFVEQSIDGFTHLDSKFFKSFFYLIGRPGFLTLQYIKGIRVPYMKPIQLFLVASLLFYFIFPHSSAYFTDVYEMNNGYVNNDKLENTFHYDIKTNLREKQIKNQESVEEGTHHFQTSAAGKAKTFLFLTVPLLALFLLLLFRKAYPYYTVHLIFALHSLAFFLLMDLVYINIFRLFGFADLDGWIFLPLIGIYATHLFLSVKKVYKNSVIASLLKTIVALFLFLCVIIIYRQLITIITIGSL